MPIWLGMQLLMGAAIGALIATSLIWRRRAYAMRGQAEVWKERAFHLLQALEEVTPESVTRASIEADPNGFIITFDNEEGEHRISYDAHSDQFFVIGNDSNEQIDLDICSDDLRILLMLAKDAWQVRQEQHR